MTTPAHCPGFEANKSLSSFKCKCPSCGAEKEIFSDEFDRPHTCRTVNSRLTFHNVVLKPASAFRVNFTNLPPKLRLFKNDWAPIETLKGAVIWKRFP